MIHCIEIKTEICFTAVKNGKWNYFIKISQYFIYKYKISIYLSYISAVSTFISKIFCYEKNIITCTYKCKMIDMIAWCWNLNGQSLINNFKGV
jgi:hypothetical protein